MSQLTIALLQMTSNGSDQDANLAKGEAFCRQAHEMGADIALFPEMWNIGYSGFCAPAEEPSDLWRAPERWSLGCGPSVPPELRRRWQAQAVARDGAYVNHFQALARK